MSKKILFRADSSSQIGLGHIMRDLVLAKQFEGDEVIFACQDLDGNIIDKIPYPTHVLKSLDIDELIELIIEKDIDMVVIDHYGINYEDEKKIKEKTGVKILCFDGSYKKHYCDFLFNQNIYAEEKKYKTLVPPFCKVFCGLEYALIRDEFKNSKKRVKRSSSNIPKVLVTLGGGDANNETLKVLKILETFTKRLDIVTVLGSANPHKKTIENFIKKSKHKNNIIVDAKNMAFLMQGTDFAISSAGSTIIELLYMEVPFFVLSIASNQDKNLKYLLENSLAYSFELLEKKLIDLKEFKFERNKELKIATKILAEELR